MVYEIDDTKTFKDQSYTSVEGEEGSKVTVIGRLEALDRRTFEVVGHWHGKRMTRLRVLVILDFESVLLGRFKL